MRRFTPGNRKIPVLQTDHNGFAKSCSRFIGVVQYTYRQRYPVPAQITAANQNPQTCHLGANMQTQTQARCVSYRSDRTVVFTKSAEERRLDWMASKRESRRKLLATLAELNAEFVHPAHHLRWSEGQSEDLLITWAYSQDLLSARDKRVLLGL